MINLLAVAAVSGALTGLAAAQGDPITTCTATLYDPPPSGKVCGVMGTLKNPPVISVQPISGETPAEHVEACRKLCYANQQCLSFALNTMKNTCRLFSRETNDIGPLNTKNTKKSRTHYDNACFDVTCTTCTPLLPSDFPTGALENPAVIFGNNSAANVDDAVFRINIPYPVQMFGDSPRTQVYVHSNGWASLGRNAGWDYIPNDLPATNNDGSSYVSSFFPFWADFYISQDTPQGLYFQVKQSTDTINLSNTLLATPRSKKLARREGAVDPDTNSRTVTLEWLVSRSVSPSDGGDPKVLWQFQVVLFADRPNVVVYNYIQVPDEYIDHVVGAQYGGDGNLGDYAQYFDSVTAGTILVYDYENNPQAGFQSVTPGMCSSQTQPPPDR